MQNILRYAEYLTPSIFEDFRDLAGNSCISFCSKQWIIYTPVWLGLCIHVISPYFGGSSLFFTHFGENLPIWNFRISLYILYISLFGISDLPTKTLAFPSLFNHSPYFETKISLFDFRDVSHVWVYVKCFCNGICNSIQTTIVTVVLICTVHKLQKYFITTFGWTITQKLTHYLLCWKAHAGKC